jgi:hypothetical protein
MLLAEVRGGCTGIPNFGRRLGSDYSLLLRGRLFALSVGFETMTSTIINENLRNLEDLGSSLVLDRTLETTRRSTESLGHQWRTGTDSTSQEPSSSVLSLVLSFLKRQTNEPHVYCQNH